MKKKLENIIYVVSALLLMWVIVSIIDINMHSLSDCQYQVWNLFEIIF